MSKMITISCNSLSETITLAGCFALKLSAGLVIGLHGPLGAGKSEFARAVIRQSCGADQEVPSPTFTLVQTYETYDGLPLYHMDLYRLETADQVFALGVEDSFYEAANLVEWPTKMGGYWPADAIEITISPQSDEARHISICAAPDFCEAIGQMAQAKGLALI